MCSRIRLYDRYLQSHGSDKKLIDDVKYFTINRARQYGKTTPKSPAYMISIQARNTYIEAVV